MEIVREKSQYLPTYPADVARQISSDEIRNKDNVIKFNEVIKKHLYEYKGNGER